MAEVLMETALAAKARAPVEVVALEMVIEVTLDNTVVPSV